MSDRSSRVESLELERLRRDLEGVSIPEFRLQRSVVMHAASHLQKCIAEADPERRVSIRVKERKSSVPKFLQSNEEYLARGPKRLMHGYDLRKISAWQMVELIASDYSMEIRAGTDGIILTPRM